MLQICLPSSIEYLPLVDTLCQAFCIWAGVHCETTDEISMAVVEAATNAVVHGNRCQRTKKMRAVFEKRLNEIAISITDEGKGFDPDSVPSPVEGDNLMKESGRGIYIIKQVMDRVEFGSTPEGGTEIRMVKQLEAHPGGRILCIDYGHKRLGIALSDELGVTAQPVGKIDAEVAEERFREIEHLVSQNDVTEIVIGLPLTLKGEVSQGASRVIAFARDLNQRLCVPVVTWDERLSTKQGEQILIQSGVSREKRKDVVDAIAAAIILQSYLDARKKK